jgi:hypothetical protein
LDFAGARQAGKGAVLLRREAEQEARDVEASGAVDLATVRLTGAVRGHVVVELEVAR